eukprot:1324913-Amorphochlora_amoeboformis.AAC.2
MGKGQAPSPKEHSLPPTMQRNATQSSSKRGSRSLKRESNEKLLTGSAKKRRVSSSCSGSSSASGFDLTFFGGKKFFKGVRMEIISRRNKEREREKRKGERDRERGGDITLHMNM